MLHKRFLIVLIFFSFFIANSCQLNTTFDRTESIENGVWNKDNAIQFSIDISDTLSAYNFYLMVHNTTEYRYSNLYVFLTTRFPNGNITRDTIECLLADQSGKWYGKGWSHVKESDVLLKSNLTFPLSGNYAFNIQQAMRQDELNGISRIGLRLVKSN